MNRILWNSRKRNDIDEVVFNGVNVHVEQMSERCYWIGIYKPGDDNVYWMGNFVSDAYGRVQFGEQEDSNVEWARIEEHRD